MRKYFVFKNKKGEIEAEAETEDSQGTQSIIGVEIVSSLDKEEVTKEEHKKAKDKLRSSPGPQAGNSTQPIE